jgi:integrase
LRPGGANAEHERLDALVDVFAALALRPSSHRTYTSILKHYFFFCAATAVDSAIAIDERRLCAAAISFCSRCSVNSLPNFVSALQWWHTNQAYGPLPRGPTYKRVQRGLRSVFGQFDKQQPAHALSLANLSHILATLDLDRYEDARNWCAILFAFYGLLRIGEYTGDAMFLRVRGVVIADDGITLTIPWSRTDTSPVNVRIAARNDLLCPVRAARHFSSFFKSTRSPDSAFFTTRTDTDRAISNQDFIGWLKGRATAIGISATNVSGHSLRRGGTTDLFLAGVPESVLALHGRWRSECYRRYFASTTPQFMATELLLAHTRSLAPLAITA